MEKKVSLFVLTRAGLANAGLFPTAQTEWWGQGVPSLAQRFPVPRRSRLRLHLQPGLLVRLMHLLCWWRLCSVLQVLHVLVLTSFGRNFKCEAMSCAKQPSFGFLGERSRRCKARMLEGMVRMFALGHIQLSRQTLTCSVIVLGMPDESV
jgi:hypothetical protein